ncbi:hypothetical protein SBY92_000686 [Candida maltosa Xu316]|uniref:Uncharacterized protein n=1 Tax=Candida maltosa (strain Xu316) TaxID=1245528 RepID=M3K1Z0_CANMX|nr:hypothetical protein G210_5959 [Candida maltosa Xu316]
MKFRSLIYTFFIIIASISAQTNEQVEFLTRIVSDLVSNSNEYIQYFRTGTQPLNLGLMRTALAMTADMTDDSYTTLARDSAFMNDLSSMATGLPWYNSRIAGGNVSSLIPETGTGTGTGSSVNGGNAVGCVGVLGVVGGLVLAVL